MGNTELDGVLWQDSHNAIGKEDSKRYRHNSGCILAKTFFPFSYQDDVNVSNTRLAAPRVPESYSNDIDSLHDEDFNFRPETYPSNKAQIIKLKKRHKRKKRDAGVMQTRPKSPAFRNLVPKRRLIGGKLNTPKSRPLSPCKTPKSIGQGNGRELMSPWDVCNIPTWDNRQERVGSWDQNPGAHSLKQDNDIAKLEEKIIKWIGLREGYLGKLSGVVSTSGFDVRR